MDKLPIKYRVVAFVVLLVIGLGITSNSFFTSVETKKVEQSQEADHEASIDVASTVALVPSAILFKAFQNDFFLLTICVITIVNCFGKARTKIFSLLRSYYKALYTSSICTHAP